MSLLSDCLPGDRRLLTAAKMFLEGLPALSAVRNDPGVRGSPATVALFRFDPNSSSDRVSPNRVLKPVDLAANQFELSVIVRFERHVAVFP